MSICICYEIRCGLIFCKLEISKNVWKCHFNSLRTKFIVQFESCQFSENKASVYTLISSWIDFWYTEISLHLMCYVMDRKFLCFRINSFWIFRSSYYLNSKRFIKMSKWLSIKFSSSLIYMKSHFYARFHPHWKEFYSFAWRISFYITKSFIMG